MNQLIILLGATEEQVREIARILNSKNIKSIRVIDLIDNNLIGIVTVKE